MIGRTNLMAGVSVAALAVASAKAGAADMLVKSPAAPPKGEFSFFLEGGGFWTAGDPTVVQLPFTAGSPQVGLKPNLGWDAAIGFDYRFAGSPWHVSTQFRYGASKSSNFSLVSPVPAFYAPITGSTLSTGSDKETHWLADFAVGRDVGIGPASVQVKAGLRIAELTSKSTVFSTTAFSGLGVGSPFSSATIAYVDEQDTSFRGAGPRLGLQGAIPLGSGWQIDYLGDVAFLFGTRRFDNPITSTATLTLAPPNSGTENQSAVTSGAAREVGAIVPNLDARIGLSYWLTPNAKLTASYRIDAYYGALYTFDAKGNERRIDRVFSGPQLTLTSTFSPDPNPSIAGVPVAAGMFTKAPQFTKAPPAPVGGQFKVFAEGSGFWTGGEPVYLFPLNGDGSFLYPGVSTVKPNFGWDTGAGFDYRVAGTPWHFGAQFLYGTASGSAPSIAGASTVTTPGPITAVFSDAASASGRETHWLADFAVGRDIGIGSETVQLKAGIRVAQLTAKSSAFDTTSLRYTTPPPAAFISAVDDEQQSTFRGVGPRLGVEGAVPFGPSWSLDYLADTAVLFGAQRFQTITVTNTAVTSTALNTSATTAAASFYNTNAAVFNADLQAGVSYWFNQNAKITAAYRLDAFLGALSTLNSFNTTTKIDRYYHGPRLILTGSF